MAIKVHREFEVTGPPELLRKFAEQAQRSLPPNWLAPEGPRDEFGVIFFTFDRERSGRVPAARLFLALRETSAKVVNIVPKTQDSLTIDEYNEVLEDFSSFARKIAAEVGLKVIELGDAASIERWLSEDAAMRLKIFSRGANKSTGSGHPLDFDRWVDFIASAFLSGNRLPGTILGRYLTEEEGWPDDQASELVSEYSFGSSMLERLSDKGTIAFNA